MNITLVSSLQINLRGHDSSLFPTLHVNLARSVTLAQRMKARKRRCCREARAAVGRQLRAVELGEHNTAASVTKVPGRIKDTGLRRAFTTSKQRFA